MKYKSRLKWKGKTQYLSFPFLIRILLMCGVFKNIFCIYLFVSYLTAKSDSRFAEVWSDVVRKSCSNTPVVKDDHDNLYTVNARYLPVIKNNSNIENSKPGKSQGRKAMGLK